MTFKARDVMSKDLVSITPTASFREIVSTLWDHHISGVPVIAPHGTLMGIVTESDLMVKEVEGKPGLCVHSQTFGLDLQSQDLMRKAKGMNARDVMTSPVLTADEDTELREVARAMSVNRVKRVVVTRNDAPVGMVTRADVLKVFLRPDEAIRMEIIDTILPHEFNVRAPSVDVAVRNGIVTLQGLIYRRSLSQLLTRYVERVEGVVGVINELDCETED